MGKLKVASRPVIPIHKPPALSWSIELINSTMSGLEEIITSYVLLPFNIKIATNTIQLSKIRRAVLTSYRNFQCSGTTIPARVSFRNCGISGP
jgi:hypothetical protein